MINKYLIIGFIALTIVLSGTIKVLYDKNVKANKAIELYSNNEESYKNIISGNIKKNNILIVRIDDLENSKDSLLAKLNNKIKDSSVKKKSITSASITSTTFSDTTKIHISEKQLLNIDTCVVKNKYTSIGIKYKDSVLTVVPSISDEFTFIYHIDREYRIKPFFKRLIKFNWRKDSKLRYEFDNSNKLIKVNDLRVINTETR